MTLAALHDLSVEELDCRETPFRKCDASPERETYRPTKELLAEGKEFMADDDMPCVMDAALITASQQVEHHEMGGYGCVRTFAHSPDK